VESIAPGYFLVGAQRNSQQLSSYEPPLLEDGRCSACHLIHTRFTVKQIHKKGGLLLQPPPPSQQDLFIRLGGALLADRFPLAARRASANRGAS